MSVRITIDNQELDVGKVEELPLALSYSLENVERFQQKNSINALNIIVPATTTNDQISNTSHNPGIEDLTTGEIFKNKRRGVIEVNGQELLVGKAFLAEGSHDIKPLDYQYDFYGSNADWLIDLKESTIYDFVKHIKFEFTKENIISSWNFDGTDPNLPYVFAPAKYSRGMEAMEVNGGMIQEYNMLPDYMKPALSKYWVIKWAFESLGYTVKSDFFDTPYFRRQVMPWTWGSFLASGGTQLDNLDFLAKSESEIKMAYVDYNGIWDMKVTNDSVNGAFDNSGVYDYDNVNKAMRFTYLPSVSFGLIEATFHFSMFVDALVTADSDIDVRLQWFKNGVMFNNGGPLNTTGKPIFSISAPTIGSRSYVGLIEDWATVYVFPGDIITCKVYLYQNDTNLGRARIYASVDAFQMDYIRIPLGGTVDFENYDSFKKHKFLTMLGGVIDEFNLCMGTDSINKIVYFEPEHPYSLVHNQSEKSGGYFNGNWIDWTDKQDLSKKSRMIQFSDYERELTFKYKDDGNDGTYNIVQDRNASKPGSAKYVFPDRFKVGEKEHENRFFSAVMHYNAIQWKGIVGDDYPQMVCLVPENISNTSRNEAENTFEPKSAYYKGLVNDFGWVFDGENMPNFPYMFAVNYKAGGQHDPILSYCDEMIGPEDNEVKGYGLVKRFFLQRLEIMRNGQYYMTYFNLNNNDVANKLHREFIICRGQRWELIEINQYRPLKNESTQVFLRKWSPIKYDIS